MFTFANVLAQPSQWEVSTTSLTALFIVLSIAIISALSKPSPDDKIYNLGGFHLVTAWAFFSKRYDFLQQHFKKTGLRMFCFNILQHRIIALAGEENRKIFYNDRSLNVGEGYRIFLGAPNVRDIDVNLEETTREFIKRLLLLLHNERVEKFVFPLLLQDVNRRMKDWGAEGKINPFNEVYDLVFQMTVRITTCGELSEDKEAVGRLAKHYWDIEKSTTAVSALLPWFPSSARKAKTKATMALYTMLLSYVQDARQKASTLSIDPIDFFIAQGISDNVIVTSIVGTIFAGVANTGINSCWALFHLGANPEWKRKAIDEYKALVDKYTNTMSPDPLHIRLSTIPLSAWEDELPSLDLIIRETLRISGSVTAFRRNIEKDIQIGEATIKQGDFVAYSMADVNLNPDIYTNPMIFDPDRYGPGREEDRKEIYGYLSWGAGRHPCAGMKMAKLEIKSVLAMILLGYEYELVDDNGNYPKALPDQDRNDLLQSRPMGDSCYLKFKRIVE